MATQLQTSEQLHEQVRRFAERNAASEVAELATEPGEFDALATAIAAYQAAYNPNYRRLINAQPAGRFGDALHAESLVPVPADAFRYASVFAFDQALAAQRFETSGTTSGQGGIHSLRTTTTYTCLSLLGAKRVFPWPSTRRPLVVALAPDGGAQPSSLGYMLQQFMQEFDGGALDPQRNAHDFDLRRRERWLVSSAGVDLDGLTQVCHLATELGAPVWLLATSFALVQLFDSCGGRRWALPAGSVVMQTGGFKGRTRELKPSEIRSLVAHHLSPTTIINEYGMTELSSQLYNRTELTALPVEPGALHDPGMDSDPTVFHEPPWLRVIPRDPVTLLPVAPGQVGLANFVDLGNIDSAVSVLTQDLVCREGTGVRLLGRNPGAPLRGCSLAIEELVSRGQ